MKYIWNVIKWNIFLFPWNRPKVSILYNCIHNLTNNPSRIKIAYKKLLRNE